MWPVHRMMPHQIIILKPLGHSGSVYPVVDQTLAPSPLPQFIDAKQVSAEEAVLTERLLDSVVVNGKISVNFSYSFYFHDVNVHLFLHNCEIAAMQVAAYICFITSSDIHD